MFGVMHNIVILYINMYYVLNTSRTAEAISARSLMSESIPHYLLTKADGKIFGIIDNIHLYYIITILGELSFGYIGYIEYIYIDAERMSGRR